MNVTDHNQPRELASRESDGLAVRLVWHPDDHAVTLSVSDSRTGDRFQLVFDSFHSVAYDPQTNSWKTLRKSVGGGLVVWTGREAIGWGGGCCGDAWGNGLAYNPATDTYRDLAPSPLARSQPGPGTSLSSSPAASHLTRRTSPIPPPSPVGPRTTLRRTSGARSHRCPSTAAPPRGMGARSLSWGPERTPAPPSPTTPARIATAALPGCPSGSRVRPPSGPATGCSSGAARRRP